MVHLVVGYPGPVAFSVVERLTSLGSPTIVIGADGLPLPSGATMIRGDCSKIDFGLSGADYLDLAARVQQLIVAEMTEHLPQPQQGFRDIELARPVRVAAEVVEFARVAPRLRGVVYLSSFDVFGDAQGAIFEKDFEIGQSFSHQRDEVLAVAEKQVHRLPDSIPRVVVRIANLIGFEKTGEILPGSELGRLAKFARAAPDECDFSFSDLPLHFETVERATEALLKAQPLSPGTTLHLIDDDPWTDRQIIKWMFGRLEKTIIDVPRGASPVTQLFRAATVQSGRVRTSRAEFERCEAVRQLGPMLSRDIGLLLERLFNRDVWGEAG